MTKFAKPECRVFFVFLSTQTGLLYVYESLWLQLRQSGGISQKINFRPVYTMYGHGHLNAALDARCYFPSIRTEIYSAKRLFSVHNANPNTNAKPNTNPNSEP